MSHVTEDGARAFVDGSLDEVDSTALRAHVAGCGSCAAEITRAARLEHATWELRQSLDFCTRCGRPLVQERDARQCDACARVRPIGAHRERPPHRLGPFGLALAAAAAVVFVLLLPPARSWQPPEPSSQGRQVEAPTSPALPALAHAGHIPLDPFSPAHEAMLAGRDPFAPGADIQQIVRLRRAQLTDCESRARLEQPPAVVTVELGLTLRYSVQPDGSTDEVSVVADQPTPFDLEFCLTQVVSSWQFPAFDGRPFATEVPLRVHIL